MRVIMTNLEGDTLALVASELLPEHSQKRIFRTHDSWTEAAEEALGRRML